MRWPAGLRRRAGAGPFAEFQKKRAELLNGTAGAPSTMWPGDIIRALAEA